MSSIKCKKCGLANFSSETDCRRCGYVFASSAKSTREKSPRSFSLSSLLLPVLLAGGAYYFYSGTQDSIEQINADEAKRVASQPAERPATPGLSRTEYDRQKAGTYGEAVKNSPGLNAHQQRVNQTEKAVKEISNSR